MRLTTILRTLFVLAGLLGAALLIAATWSTVIEVKVNTVVKTTIDGHARHGYALVIAAVFAVVMLFAAVVVGRTSVALSRAPMLAVAAMGALALAIAIVSDVPDLHKTGTVGQLYEDATAKAGSGFFLETLGGALLLIGGGGLLVFSGAGPAPRRVSADVEPAL